MATACDGLKTADSATSLLTVLVTPSNVMSNLKALGFTRSTTVSVKVELSALGSVMDVAGGRKAQSLQSHPYKATGWNPPTCTRRLMMNFH